MTAVDFWSKTLLFTIQQVRNSMTQLTLLCNNYANCNSLEINNPNYLFHKNRTSQLKREWLNEITHQVKDGWISGLVNFNKRLVVDYNKQMITTIIFLGSPIQLLSYFFWRLNWNLIQRCYLTSFNVLLWPLFWQKQRSEQNIAG